MVQDVDSMKGYVKKLYSLRSRQYKFEFTNFKHLKFCGISYVNLKKKFIPRIVIKIPRLCLQRRRTIICVLYARTHLNATTQMITLGTKAPLSVSLRMEATLPGPKSLTSVATLGWLRTAPLWQLPGTTSTSARTAPGYPSITRPRRAPGQPDPGRGTWPMAESPMLTPYRK